MRPPLLPADDPDALRQAEVALRAGQLVVVPTETVYGIACLPTAEALARLVAAKGRGPGKGLSLLVRGIEAAERLAVVPEPARRLMVALWPGPLTLVLPRRTGVGLPDLLHGGRDTLAFRMPDHAVPLLLAERLGPLALSSANRSGERDATTAAEAADALGGSVQLVLDGGPTKAGLPSTVVAVQAEGSWSLLRAGALPPEAISDALAGEPRPPGRPLHSDPGPPLEETPR